MLPAPQFMPCPACGVGAARLTTRRPLYVRRHQKLGCGWLLLIFFSGGLLLLPWLFMHTQELIGYDTVSICSRCRQVVT